ncbi:MAG: hypothetical protein Q9157_008935 [Trypethelium eluteriae]
METDHDTIRRKKGNEIIAGSFESLPGLGLEIDEFDFERWRTRRGHFVDRDNARLWLEDRIRRKNYEHTPTLKHAYPSVKVRGMSGHHHQVKCIRPTFGLRCIQQDHMMELGIPHSQDEDQF